MIGQILVTHHDPSCVDRSLSRLALDSFCNLKATLKFRSATDYLSKGQVLLIGGRQCISKTNTLGNRGQFVLRNSKAFKDIANGLLSAKG